MKSFVITSILFISITLTGHPQSIVTIPIEQNPLFEVSTNRVNISGVDLSQRLVLGGDIVVKGGSGHYTYHWHTPAGASVGTSQTITISSPGTYLLDITDTCDCMQTVDFNIESSGLSRNEMTQCAITPNPTAGPVKITGFNPVQISVVNMSGQLETLIDLNGAIIHDADFSNFSKGIYILTLTDREGKISVTRLIKK